MTRGYLTGDRKRAKNSNVEKALKNISRTIRLARLFKRRNHEPSLSLAARASECLSRGCACRLISSARFVRSFKAPVSAAQRTLPRRRSQLTTESYVAALRYSDTSVLSVGIPECASRGETRRGAHRCLALSVHAMQQVKSDSPQLATPQQRTWRLRCGARAASLGVRDS